MKPKLNIFSVIQLVIFVLSLVTDWYAPLVIGLMINILVLMLDKLGKGVVLREIIALHTCFVCLMMPVAGYAFFDKSNKVSRMFYKYMMVPDHVYFSFALPAITGFILVLCWPIDTGKYSDSGTFLQGTIDRARIVLQRKPKIGIYLLIIGTLMFGLARFLPAALQFAFMLFFFSSFAGFLYVYYLPVFRYRRIILFFFGAFIITMALSSGMFTIVAYMSLTLFSFFFMGRKTSFWRKLMILLLGIFMLLIIQSVKPTYRLLTWGQEYEGNKALLFGSLVIDKITDFNFGSPNAFFMMYVRANQGFNISLVMRRIPDKIPYDGGENLFLSLASSVVPRIFWPDKPVAGGKYNMKYYAGLSIHGWSTNVGPLGEAYGSFGPAGGVLFMCFLGFFMRWAYSLVFKKAREIPLIIFWIPVLFYQSTYSAETDTLQIFNSIIKSAFFIWMLYKQWPICFGIEKAEKRFWVNKKAISVLTDPTTH